MPFKSKAQRRHIIKNHPKIAEKWEKETKEVLPERLSPTREQKAISMLGRGMRGESK